MKRFVVLLGVVVAEHGIGGCADTTEPPVPTTVAIVDGDGQAALYGMALPDSLQVQGG
jgi:hypothetical protein